MACNKSKTSLMKINDIFLMLRTRIILLSLFVKNIFHVYVIREVFLLYFVCYYSISPLLQHLKCYFNHPHCTSTAKGL